MNKFNFNRFGKVVVRDFHNACTLYGMSMLIMVLVPSAIWLIGLVFGLNYADADGTDLVMRHMVVIIMAYLAAAIAPLKIYNSCNLRGKGNYFAMLPATLGEKFCSMLLYCFIVSPLAVFCGAYLVDTLLTLFPFGPNKDFLWNEPQWLNSLGEEINFGLPQIVLIFATQIFSYSAVFMFANTIFSPVAHADRLCRIYHFHPHFDACRLEWQLYGNHCQVGREHKPRQSVVDYYLDWHVAECSDSSGVLVLHLPSSEENAILKQQ